MMTLILGVTFLGYSMDERRKIDCVSPRAQKKIHYGTFRYDETNRSPVVIHQPTESPVPFDTKYFVDDENTSFANVLFVETIFRSGFLDKIKS